MPLLQPKNIKVIDSLLQQFLPFAREKWGYDATPDIRLASDPDNAKKPLGKTAYYEPDHERITVYINDRHPKDIVRSVSHELVHHVQNLRGDLAGSTGVGEQGYAQNDEHLREMEREAYEQGNLCFRDWEDGIKTAHPNMYNEGISRRTRKVDRFTKRNNSLNERLMKKFRLKTKVRESLNIRIEESANDLPEWMYNYLEHEFDNEGVSTEGADFDEIGAQWSAFQQAAEAALVELLGEEKADAYLSEDGDLYLLFQTIVESGRSFLDGDMDHLGIPEPELEQLARNLQGKLGEFVDYTGGGSLNDAIHNAIDRASGIEEKNIVQEDEGDDVIQKALAIFPEAEVHEDGYGGYEIVLNPESIARLENDPALQGQVSDAFGDTWEMTEGGISVGADDGEWMEDRFHDDQELEESGDLGPRDKDDKEETETLTHKTSGKEIVVTKAAAKKKRESGEWSESIQNVFNKNPGYIKIIKESGISTEELVKRIKEAFRGSPEEKEMTSKMSNKEFSDYHTRDKHIVPDLKGDMEPIPGMEGPFQFPSGAVLYYDPKVGQYYDRGKDMYLDREEAERQTMKEESGGTITYSKSAYGYTIEGTDETVGGMIVALVDAGIFGRYEVREKDSLQRMQAAVESGKERSIESFDSDLLESHYNIDIVGVIQDFAKLKGMTAQEGEAESDDDYYEENKRPVSEEVDDDDVFWDEAYAAGYAGKEPDYLAQTFPEAYEEGKRDKAEGKPPKTGGVTNQFAGIGESQEAKFQAGDKVTLLGSVNSGSSGVVADVKLVNGVPGYVVTLDDGRTVEVREKFLSKAEGGDETMADDFMEGVVDKLHARLKEYGYGEEYDDDPEMASLEAEFPWLRDAKAEVAADPDAEAAAAADAEASGEFGLPPEEEEEEDPTVMKQEGAFSDQDIGDSEQGVGAYAGSEEGSADPVEIIGSLIHQNGFMNARDSLEQMGFEVDFVTEPLTMYLIQRDGVKYAALNKSYAEDPDLVVGDIAIGVMNESKFPWLEGKEELDVDDDGDIGADDLKDLRSGKKDEDVGEEVEEKEDEKKEESLYTPRNNRLAESLWKWAVK